MIISTGWDPGILTESLQITGTHNIAGQFAITGTLNILENK